MTSASVGFQCPECVAEGRASVRPVVTRLGVRAITRPYVTLGLIAINVVVFGLTMTAGKDADTGYDVITLHYGLNPFSVAVGNEYYRLLTAMFLHAGFLHIAFNMLALWVVGPQLEALLGHVRFSVLYLVAGLGGSVASFWFSSPNILGVGASGAIYGLFGALFVVARRLKFDIRPIAGVIVINVVIGFVAPGLDWRAHLGGLATGAIVAALFAYLPVAPWRAAVQTLGVLVIVGLLVVAVVVRDQAITDLAQQIIDGTA